MKTYAELSKSIITAQTSQVSFRKKT